MAAIKIRHVNPWPVGLAFDDLDGALGLYYYAKYGLQLRELLEIDGPYEINHSRFDSHFVNGLGIVGMGKVEDDRRIFARRKEQLEKVARFQYVVTAFSVFEFFIANLIIFLYIAARDCPTNDGYGFHFIWDDALPRALLREPCISDIETPEWMERNHRDRELKARIKMLKRLFEIDIRGFHTVDSAGREFDWGRFRRLLPTRHAAAHTAARHSIHGKQQFSHRELTDEELVGLDTYLQQLLAYALNRLYELPVIKYVHRDEV